MNTPAPNDFRLYLQSELVRRCKANPRYSLRAFANSLELDAGTLSKILSGKRVLGRKALERLGGRLGLRPDVIASHLPNHSRAPLSPAPQVIQYKQLGLDAFQIISDWYHYAILELIEVEGFTPSPRWLASALGLSVNEINAALERLKRVGLLKVESDGKWIDTSGGFTTDALDGKTSSAHRNLQAQLLEKALVALQEVPIEERANSSVSVAVNTELLPEIRKKIKVFRRELNAFISSQAGARKKKKNEVYNLSIAFFPLSRCSRNKRRAK